MTIINKISNKDRPLLNRAADPVSKERSLLFIENTIKEGSLVSGSVINNQFVVANFTSEYRGFFDVTQTALRTLSIPSSFLSNPSMSVVYQSMGMTTGLNSVIGTIQVYHRVKDVQKASRIRDKKGVLLGRIGLIKEGASACAGTGYALFRPLSIINATGNGSHLLGRATYGLGLLGNIGFGIMNFFNGVANGLNLYFTSQFQGKFNKTHNLKEKLAFLKKKLQVERKDVFQKLIKKKSGQLYKKSPGQLLEVESKQVQNAIKKDLSERIFQTGIEELKVLIGKHQISLSDGECKQVMNKFLASMDDEALMSQGLDLLECEIREKNETKLSRFLSKDTIRELKNYFSGNIDALQPSELLEKVNLSLNEKKTLYAVCLIVAVLGAISIGLSLLTPVGWLGLAVSVIVLFSSLAASALDGYSLFKSLESGDVAKHDKKFILLSTLTCMASVATVVGLMASGVVSFGVVPLIITIGLGLIWLGQNAYILEKVDAHQKQAFSRDPNLENLLQLLQFYDYEDMSELLKLLPKEIHDHILDKWKSLYPDTCFQSEEELVVVIQQILTEQKRGLEEMLRELAKSS